MVDNKPNLFIVGAPKCGTSFLHEHLAEHPDIFMSPLKEPNFFDKDLHYTSPRFTLDKYLLLFKDANNKKVIGEASPWYLYSSEASKEIHRFNPEAKIIIMLRNPVEMMYSLHGENLYHGNEIVEDFEKALSLEEDRKRGINIHKNSNPAESVYYKGIASYSTQVKRYYSEFGRKNVMVIIFDDLKNNAEEVYVNTLEFLGVDVTFKPEIKIVNPSKVAKSVAVREFVLRPSKLLRSLALVLFPSHRLRIFIQNKIIQMNSRVVVKREVVDSKLLERLKAEMSADIMELSKLLGRDLNHWVNS